MEIDDLIHVDLLRQMHFGSGHYPGWAAPLVKGDRVRIRKGYDHAGDVGFYHSKSNANASDIVVKFPEGKRRILAAAIEPYPYTREECIERAIEDANDMLRREYGKCFSPMRPVMHALLFALLDAGV